MRPALTHYQSPDEDSGRWFGFRFRPGDIVISTRRKTGTTWMQMICALLIFQTPELPDSLWHLSPWLDNVAIPLSFQYGQLAEQQHRRFIKTHTPLDGIPLHPEVTYIVTARHPLDTFVSLCRHNEAIGHPPEGSGPPPPTHIGGPPGPPAGGLRASAANAQRRPAGAADAGRAARAGRATETGHATQAGRVAYAGRSALASPIPRTPDAAGHAGDGARTAYVARDAARRPARLDR